MHDHKHEPHRASAPAHGHGPAPQPAANHAPAVHAGHDETMALLAYLVEHNRSHASELKDLAREVRGPAKDQITEAIELLDRSNAKLAAALETLKRD